MFIQNFYKIININILQNIRKHLFQETLKIKDQNPLILGFCLIYIIFAIKLTKKQTLLRINNVYFPEKLLINLSIRGRFLLYNIPKLFLKYIKSKETNVRS